jgi:hypothetical protein
MNIDRRGLSPPIISSFLRRNNNMFVVIQRPVHVDIDEELEVRAFEDTPDDDAEYFNTFILEHEAAGNGVFTVMISPYSYDQNSIMCEEPSKFTVDYEALVEIYKDPAKFILEYVVKYDERYKISDNNIRSQRVDLCGCLDKIPCGLTVTQYISKNGAVAETVVYNDIPKHEIQQRKLLCWMKSLDKVTTQCSLHPRMQKHTSKRETTSLMPPRKMKRKRKKTQ